MFVVYVDDGIFFGTDKKDILSAIQDMKDAGYDIENKGSVSDYLGVNVNRTDDGTIELTQPHLVDQLIQDINLNGTNFNPPKIPAKSSRILQRFEGAPAFNGR